MKFVAAKCPNCGAQIQVDKNSNSTICEFCEISTNGMQRTKSMNILNELEKTINTDQ